MLAKKVSPNLWILQSERLRLFLDLQYRSIAHTLRAEIASYPAEGDVLDFGSGYSRYRHWLPQSWRYVSVDLDGSGSHRSMAEVPAAARFDRIWTIETLEHIADPQSILEELRERLKPNGEIWISVPFSARVHPCPHDFLRWTPEALRSLLESAGYTVKSIEPRGSDFATIVSKLVYFFARRMGVNLWTLLGLGLSPLVFMGVVICQFGAHVHPREAEDPLGFVVKASSR